MHALGPRPHPGSERLPRAFARELQQTQRPPTGPGPGRGERLENLRRYADHPAPYRTESGLPASRQW
jgi:hypothetical protein